jgi:hypothetical protein
MLLLNDDDQEYDWQTVLVVNPGVLSTNDSKKLIQLVLKNEHGSEKTAGLLQVVESNGKGALKEVESNGKSALKEVETGMEYKFNWHIYHL